MIKFYRCRLCGKIIEVINDTPSALECCNTQMDLLKVNSVDASNEKHVPFVTLIDGVAEVQIGEMLHPASAEHHIEFIVAETNRRKITLFHLDPLEEPRRKICLCQKCDEKLVAVYSYCNLHGLWLKEFN